MKLPEFIKNIDWKLLREQKEDLIQVITDMEFEAERYRKDGEPDGADEIDREAGSLQGIVHLIDAIQDYAVDELGMNESTVFIEFPKE